MLSNNVKQQRGKMAPTKIVTARFDGASLQTIAKRFGLTQREVSQILRDHDIYCFARAEPRHFSSIPERFI